jgi:preprotein translocase subunit SecE
VEEVLSAVRQPQAAQGVEVAVSLATMAGRTTRYIRDVRTEVSKVTWPSLEDLRRSTLVIIVVVIIIGIIIGVMDFLFSKIVIDFFPRLFA